VDGSRAILEEVGGGLRLPLDTIGPVVCQKSHYKASKPHYMVKQTAVSSYGQQEHLHTNATLLKLAKHCHSLFITLRGHTKSSGKKSWLSITILL